MTPDTAPLARRRRQRLSEDQRRAQIINGCLDVLARDGYRSASVARIAEAAGVSKGLLAHYFTDKETLFGEVVRSTATRTNDIVDTVTAMMSETKFAEGGLGELARLLVTMLLDDDLLKLRRLIIANADRMPELGRDWYEKGFERMLATMASCFRKLSAQGLMQASDPHLAASHFFGMLLWIPMNEAMFTGSRTPRSKAELERHADASVEAFLVIYGAKLRPQQDGTR